MIKLIDLIEQNESMNSGYRELKTDIPDNPFDNVRDDNLYVNDDDENMDEEEWETFQSCLKTFLNDVRINKLTKEMLDVDEIITELLLMKKETRNRLDHMTDKEINKIRKILHQKRKSGNVCSMFKSVGIKYLGDRNKLKYDWEKDYYNKHYRK